MAPLGAWVPAAGLVEITWSWGRLLASATTFTVKPAWPSSLAAWSWEIPVTSGTDTVVGPLETVRMTWVPWGTLAPASGVWDSTVPDAELLA